MTNWPLIDATHPDDDPRTRAMQTALRDADQGDDHDPTETYTPEQDAECSARNGAAWADAERFYELLPPDHYYWRAIEMERLTRHVLHDTAGADEWLELIEKIRMRVNAQIESEKVNNE